MHDQATIETAVVDALVAGSTPCSSLPDEELLVAIDELAARRRRIDAALTAAAGEVRARSEGLPAEDSLVRKAGHRTEASMLQHRVGLRAREAHVLCEVAEATRSRVTLTGADIPVPFPQVAAALAAGWVSVPQAHAIIDILASSNGRVSVDDLGRAEADLVTRACGTAVDDDAPMLPEDLAIAARRWLGHLDPDGEEPRYDDQVAARFLRMRRRRDGSWFGTFCATADQGDALMTAFDAHVKPRRVQFQDACGQEDETPAPTTADDDPETEVEVEVEAEVEVDDRTRDQRRLDALVAIVTRHAETTSPRISGEAPVLTITISEDALHGRSDQLSDLPLLNRSGDTIPISIAARMLCDGFVQPVIHGTHGEPLRQGRKERLFTKAQRRAIIARDHHCRAPGCTAPPGWCETHHVRRWADHGPTDVDNGILLCQHHHTEAHRGTLAITTGTTRRWHITTTHRPRPRTRPPLRR